MAYYYAAAIHEEGIVRPEGDIPPSVRALTFDDALDRFVLRTQPDSLPIPAEWSEVDEALIEADYPGLLGGA
jgi:hypothetical protein